MAEQAKVGEPAGQEEITENDKLMATLAYPTAVVGIIIPMTVFVDGCGGLLPLLLFWLLALYGTYLVYQGQYLEIPVITDFI